MDATPDETHATRAPWPWAHPPAPVVHAQLQALVGRLRRAPVFLLVDPYLGAPSHFGQAPEGAEDDSTPPEDAQALAQWRQSHCQRPVTLVHERPMQRVNLCARQAPYLVELSGPHDPLLALSMRMAMQEQLLFIAQGRGPCRIGGWLQPAEPASGARLGRWLEHLLQWHGPGDDYAVLCLADRRVLQLLHAATGTPGSDGGAAPDIALPDIDWPATLQGLHGWAWLDWNLQLAGLEGAPGPLHQSALPLEAAHLDLLEASEAVNRTLAILARTLHPLPTGHWRPVREAVRIAQRRHGLSIPSDQAAYAAEAIAHPGFIHWPGLAQLLQDVLAGQHELGPALALHRPHWQGQPAPPDDSQGRKLS